MRPGYSLFAIGDSQNTQCGGFIVIISYDVLLFVVCDLMCSEEGNVCGETMM